MNITPKKVLDATELKLLDEFIKSSQQDMCLERTHGFFTAILSFPEIIMANEWLPVLLGDKNSIFKDINHGNETLDLIMTLHNEIALMLYNQEKFKITIAKSGLRSTFSEAPLTSLQNWCNGYCMALIWNSEYLECLPDLGIFGTFFFLSKRASTKDLFDRIPDGYTEETLYQAHLDLLPIVVNGIYQDSQSERLENDSSDYGDSKIGRNDPCICGSGKKYKKCCLM